MPATSEAELQRASAEVVESISIALALLIPSELERAGMKTLKAMIDNSDSKVGKSFDLFIQALIVLSMITFAVETLPNLSPGFQFALNLFEFLSVAVFTGEYLLRLFLAENKRKFATSFFGIIDLLAILPFFLLLGFDGRSIRAFRLLRLFRVMKFARYSQAIQRYHRALLISKEEIVIFLAATGIVLFLSAAGIYHFEHDAQPVIFSSVFHSLWWAVVTLTSVGYGDTYPITSGGRFFTFGVLMIGLGVVSVPSGLIAAALTKARQDMEQDTFGAKSEKIRTEASRLPTNSRPAPHSPPSEPAATDLQGVDALLSLPLGVGEGNFKRGEEVVNHQCEHCGARD